MLLTAAAAFALFECALLTGIYVGSLYAVELPMRRAVASLISWRPRRSRALLPRAPSNAASTPLPPPAFLSELKKQTEGEGELRKRGAAPPDASEPASAARSDSIPAAFVPARRRRSWLPPLPSRDDPDVILRRFAGVAAACAVAVAVVAAEARSGRAGADPLLQVPES